ncbi:YrhC family protein [Sporolactobacillus spathodeae]|uniref:YrhC-like protein n=1 Tax=Sporolactobacillus spathodeae TaxID=1465502 RepID=A0ABS2Q6U9_9BACL|nr:YrhC family protein [Sporolactobacillus spathodeae]MBM7657376.1 hypothetical protein [Sporolactobacillus spathodeae]
MTEQQRKIAATIIDCRRTGLFCLYLSAFLYVGSLLPKFAAFPEKVAVLSGSSFGFTLLAIFFYWRISRLKELD